MKKIIVLAIALTVGSVVSAQMKTAVHLHENQADGTIIPKEIYGQFSEHLGSCIYGGLWVGPDSDIPNINGYRKDVFDALKRLQIPVLRWPGGCFADDYHWMDGIGPMEKRPKISNNNWGGTMEDNSFGTHEFLNLCEMLECQPYISGNVGSGTAEEMAKWVEYMTSDSKSTVADMRRANGREKPWNVKYFGIGNEAWGCGGNMRPEYYSDVFRRYTVYTRNFLETPLYKIASGACDYDYAWTETCMKMIGGRMSAIAVHYYSGVERSGDGTAASFDDYGYYNVLAKACGIEPCLLRHMEIMDRYDPDRNVDLIVDEWGTWWSVEPGTNPGHLFQQNTMRDAMVAALSLNIFQKYTKRIKMANIAQVVNVLQAMILTKGNQMVLTPTYHIFDMYRVHQDAEYIPAEYESEPILWTSKGNVPTLSVSASRKDGVMHVSIVNPSKDKTHTVLLDWDSFKSAKNVKVSGVILNAADVHDFNDFGQSPKIAPEEFKDMRRNSEGIEVKMPQASVVVLEIK
ncbi:MAG: alpha-N-arabinofuranosidase [Alistipes sp.]|nr:alpha-N-arabinofuranosidase [Candidatus Minthomonas equi]